MDFGQLSRKIDATPYRGRRVRLSGWLRFDPAGLPGSARIWMRVERGARDAFIDNLDAHPVRSAAWTAATILGEVAPDADSIAFGAALDSYGTAWIDDLSLEPLGPIGEGDRPPRAVSDRGVANLVAFGRLLGYVRHFHPSDESAANDWESFAIAGVDEIEDAATPRELATRLEKLFRPLAPTLRIATHRLKPLARRSIAGAARATRVTGWWHFGWTSSRPGNIYYERRVSAPITTHVDSIAPLGSDVNVEIAEGVWCSVPLTLYADARGTLPRGTASTPASRRPPGWFPSGNDRATRLADVILFWNVAQHFYPYFDVVDTDWPAVLPEALRRAALDRDGAAFETTLHRMVSRLHDGHGAVNSPYSDYASLPIAWRFVADTLVIQRADSTIAGRVHPGDRVIAIQGRPLSEWVREAEAIESAATPQLLSVRVAQALQVIPGADTVALELESPAGATRAERVARRSGPWLAPPRPSSVSEIRPGVMYLDLDRITDQDFSDALPRIESARGVIFDLRGYPHRLSTIVLAHLIDTTITCARWNVPVITRPDHRDPAFHFSNWTVPPAASRIHARAAFLIGGGAISYAETYLEMVEHYRLAELVGEPTAGTNGNVTDVNLPGGYDVTFTGMKVLKHDGSRHHGVGILPTVPVSPTVAGIAAGRDEQLEKAIEVVSR
jgi:C-terminal processing protease CtpA/Prc